MTIQGKTEGQCPHCKGRGWAPSVPIRGPLLWELRAWIKQLFASRQERT